MILNDLIFKLGFKRSKKSFLVGKKYFPVWDNMQKDFRSESITFVNIKEKEIMKLLMHHIIYPHMNKLLIP